MPGRRMQLIRHFREVIRSEHPCVFAVGAFDGMHLGHQAVLARLTECAARLGGEACVALRIAAPRPALASLRYRLRSLAEHGVTRTVLLRAGAPDDSTVTAAVGANVLVSGRGVAVPPSCRLELVEPVVIDGAPVSMHHLRAALQSGDLAAVRRGLGRDATVDGRIVHGFHRGGPIGIPTANLRVRDLALPPDGVYAVRACLAGAILQGVANIGFNPTFGNRARSVETHLLDFRGYVYGERLEIAFVARLRGELKFSGLDALLAQIRTDIDAARTLFGAGPHDG